jgi:bacterioferritin (cytochrome b1)
MSFDVTFSERNNEGLQALIANLKNDLRNEWTHLTFYLHSAALIQGLHATEYKELLQKEANKELLHVSQFSDMLIGLGVAPQDLPKEPYYEKVPSLTMPGHILAHALKLEQEVVANYCQRMHEAEACGCTDGDWVHIFLEGQIQDSREDVDHLKQILRGI